jgi:hypothetical protein
MLKTKPILAVDAMLWIGNLPAKAEIFQAIVTESKAGKKAVTESKLAARLKKGKKILVWVYPDTDACESSPEPVRKKKPKAPSRNKTQRMRPRTGGYVPPG